MAYADYQFYTDTYHGDILTSANADKWLERGSDYIDTITFMRTVYAFPTEQTDVIRIKKAVCAIAETLFKIDSYEQSVTPTVQSSGEITGAVASISSGRESISYTNDRDASMYAKAVSSQEEKLNLVKQVAINYLINVLDANGQFIIYRGIDNVR